MEVAALDLNVACQGTTPKTTTCCNKTEDLKKWQNWHAVEPLHLKTISQSVGMYD